LVPEEALHIPADSWGRLLILGPTPLIPNRAILKYVKFSTPAAKTIHCPERAKKLIGGAGEIAAPWARMDDYPPFFPPQTFVTDFFDWFYAGVGKNARESARGGGSLGWLNRPGSVEAAAVCYPEEFEYRDYTRSNWLIVVRITDGQGNQKDIIYRPQILAKAHSQFQRMPRLAALQRKTASVIGVGALGSHVAVELARSGIGRLCLVDGDILEPANLVRHACTLQDIGLNKAKAVARRIGFINTTCEVDVLPTNLGGLNPGKPEETRTEAAAILSLIQQSDLIVDATADHSTSFLINKIASSLSIPHVHVWGTNGGFGGEVIRVIPGLTGCFECFSLQHKNPLALKRPREDKALVPALGCSDRTFTGTGFDMTSVALLASRISIQTILRDEDAAYPDSDYDYLSWENISDRGEGLPRILDTRQIPRSQECRICNHNSA
ncbi:MAG: ThiF family adenylyltransferase, partial [Chloroflexi bacterium]|nr:ThiF family adenylyltransferase [Chloroflexota bacterium]